LLSASSQELYPRVVLRGEVLWFDRLGAGHDPGRQDLVECYRELFEGVRVRPDRNQGAERRVRLVAEGILDGIRRKGPGEPKVQIAAVRARSARKLHGRIIVAAPSGGVNSFSGAVRHRYRL
jgi:hypothetical protein